ncbi:lantibiotic dehydratase [Streptomyces violarus]|uniref:lantibiotic dehydratase n=1 Tax=Streptomyces violarus TaxID=67380 RepID=UPI0021C011BA|nr:lantibiotic dehydratase [Streptomyces violarus]MCT9139772.1 lantibiotic dehydratase [Streptomyces violarus]
MAARIFAASDPILVRAATLEVGCLPSHDVVPDTTTAVLNEADLVAYVEGVARHPVLKEAIELSSASLAETLARIVSGEDLGAKRLLKAAISLTKYALRITGRPTPFGLYAGVAAGRFDAKAQVRVGQRHRKAIRPDAGWFAQVMDGILANPQALADAHLVTNDLVTVRAGRVYFPWARTVEQDSFHLQEVSIRLTPAVESIVRHARHPVSCRHLIELVSKETGIGPEAVEKTLVQLTRRDFLLSSVSPRDISLDSLESLVDHRRADLVSAGQQALGTYVRTLPGEGSESLKSAVESLLALQKYPRPPVQVDLRMDMDVALPRSVAEEIEGLATLLWRISPPDWMPEHLREYAEAFIERYGYDNPVGVQEILDPHTGLGLPATYKGSTRATRHHHPPHQRSRDALLAEAVQQCLMRGDSEILLDESLVRLLEGDARDAGRGENPPASLELCVQLLAESASALDSRDYRLLLSRYGGSLTVGATFGRFADLIGVTDELKGLVTHRNDGSTPLQLRFAPNSPRHTNVSQVPDILTEQLTVGVFPQDTGKDRIDWRDLDVVAHGDRLRLAHRTTGEPVTPLSLSALALDLTAPAVARFLHETATCPFPPLMPWSWGAMEQLPFLPRVRWGRVIIKPARWNVPVSLTERNSTWSQWVEALDAWREAWRVPRFIQISTSDEICSLDLDNSLHLRLLRQELFSREVEVTENLAANANAFGWIGGHANELVVPLRSRSEGAGRPAPKIRASLPVVRKRLPAYSPGSEWLYAKIYATPELHDTLLTSRLPSFVNDIAPHIDQWFYIRYQDPDPHLRLRLHGASYELVQYVLPKLHTFLEMLRDERLLGRWVLDTYEPEFQRYGGAELIRGAESLFSLDSTSAIYQISAAAGRQLTVPDEVLAAANYALSLEALGEWKWWEWAATAYPNHDEQRKYYRTVRDLARTWIRPGHALETYTERSGSDFVRRIWCDAKEVRAYGRALLGEVPSERRDSALRGILHMQHNRLIGIHPEKEDRSYAVLRGIARDHIGRTSLAR